MGQHILRAIYVVGFGASVLAMGGCKPVVARCGDGFCDSPETPTSCPSDCRTGGRCGDSFCDVGENCASCATDCGVCTGCPDGACNAAAGETCSTCPTDCGSCNPCGDGFCNSGSGETCTSCPGDCGSCGTVGAYGQCTRDMDCAIARDRCIAVSSGGVTRAFCGVRNCATDADCDLDMFNSPGLCVSFSGGTEFDCFHRCNSTGDCPSGFVCSPSDGVSSHMVCLPGSTASVPPYRICGSTADCAGGLICETFSVSGAAPAHLCSRTGCTTDNDCPIDMRGGRGACLNFGAGMTACWERCTVRGDCANTTQFDCSTQVGGFTAPVPVCVPR